MDRKLRRELERSVASLEVDVSGPSVTYLDELGPAIYQTEPVWRTAIICLRCSHVALLITIPRRAELTWTCSQCGWAAPLRPPAAVLAVPDPVHPRLATMRPRRPSTPLGERSPRRLS